jgi:translation elongation factor P/translation initiation factor 5A
MEQKKLLSTLAALTVTCTMGAACAAQQQEAAPPQGQAQSARPAAIAVETVSCTATVQAIDDAKRTVTLKDSDGATITYKAGKDVINFDQIKVGDEIEAKLVRQLALFVRKPDAPAVDGEAAGVALAPKGAMPGGIVIDTVQVTDKIEAIDPQKRLVTLIGEDGQSLTVHLGPKVNLAELRKGDLVVARLTDGLILAVQKAPQPQLAEAKLTGAAVVSTMRCTATVKAIDYDKRTITLREPDGATDTYKAGNSIANFDQIKAGDQVQATLVESLAIHLRKAGAPAGEEETGAVALAPRGALPGVIMADTVQASAKVETIDEQKRLVTLQDANGNSHTIHVGPRVDLAAFQKGDDVVARYTQGLAILVEK